MKLLKKLVVYIWLILTILIILFVGYGFLNIDEFQKEIQEQNNIEQNISINENGFTENEKNIIEKTHVAFNDVREENNKQRLQLNNNITEITKFKSQQMNEKNYFDHTSPSGQTVRDRFDKFNMCTQQNVSENLVHTQYKENVYVNYQTVNKYTTEKELVEGIVNSIKNSQSHYDNLLHDEWSEHGLYVKITNDNEVYFTHKFCE